MPGAVPQTSTLALTHATFPYLLQLANLGWESACLKSSALQGGLTLVNGKILNAEIARLFKKKYTPLREILDFESR